jgi:hypothetical protein
MTKKNENNLTARQKQALPFFIGSSSYEEGCRRAKVSKNAFYSWLKEPLFKAELDRLRDGIFEEALYSLKQNSTKAATILGDLLDSSNESIKRATANDILNHAVRFKEIQELTHRIETLEEETYAKSK